MLLTFVPYCILSCDVTKSTRIGNSILIYKTTMIKYLNILSYSTNYNKVIRES